MRVPRFRLAFLLTPVLAALVGCGSSGTPAPVPPEGPASTEATPAPATPREGPVPVPAPAEVPAPSPESPAAEKVVPHPRPTFPPQREAPAVETKGGTKVYTNEDLERLGGPTPSNLPAAEPEKPGAAASRTGEPKLLSAEELIRREQESRALRQVRIAKAEEEVARLEGRVRELDRRLVAVHNPYLPRPQVPEEMRDEWEKMDERQRADLTRRQLDQAKADLEKARAHLRELQSAQ